MSKYTVDFYVTKDSHSGEDIKVKIIDGNHSVQRFKERSEGEKSVVEYIRCLKDGIREIIDTYSSEPGYYVVKSKSNKVKFPVEIYDDPTEKAYSKCIKAVINTTYKIDWKNNAYDVFDSRYSEKWSPNIIVESFDHIKDERKKKAVRTVFSVGVPKIFVDADQEIIKEMLELVVEFDNIIVNVSENHYKYWAYEITRNGIKYVWGRIGKTRQELEKPDTKWDAESKKHDKINKGYVVIGWSER